MKKKMIFLVASVLSLALLTQCKDKPITSSNDDEVRKRAEKSMSDWGKNPGKRKPVDVTNFGK